MTVATTRSPIPEIDALTLRTWLKKRQVTLIDVREPGEYAQEHIRGTDVLVPLSNFDPQKIPNHPNKQLVLYCKSGRRSGLAAQELLKVGWTEVTHLQGGITAWKAAAYPVETRRNAPISVMRQVQVIAGSLVVVSTALGAWVSPWFLLVDMSVGSILLFSGLTRFCAFKLFLSKLPYNQQDGVA